MPHSPNELLDQNIQLLNGLLSKILKKNMNSKLFGTVEKIFSHAFHFKQKPEETIKLLQKQIKRLSNQQILPVTRAFSHYLHLAEIAEQYHRVQRYNWHKQVGHPSQPGSLEAVLPMLLDRGVAPDLLIQTISKLNIELVLTAHPTEVNRPTLIRKYNKIAMQLAALDKENLTAYKQKVIINKLKAEIQSAWQTEEIRHHKPTVIDEAKWGFSVIKESLWHAVPAFMRDLNQTIFETTGKTLPLGVMPIRFASWMGGDRDGNPNVTTKVTKEVVLLARLTAVDLYLQDIRSLIELLLECNLRSQSKTLAEIEKRLIQTKHWVEFQLGQRQKPPNKKGYSESSYLFKSLVEFNHSIKDLNISQSIKDKVFDIIQCATCFGLCLIPLDIRQNAKKHIELMNAITEQMELGTYSTWSEIKRQQFLKKCLRSKKKWLPENLKLPLELQEYLETFEVIATLPQDSFGAYVISMASKPSDVLLVLVLQKTIGISKPLRIAPLFETLADLNNAASCIQQLFNMKEYKSTCQGKQEIMIGYSDSAKDAGLLTASWAQYRVQEALIQVGKQHKIDILFFHGRGGSVGRGGGPTHFSIRSQPPGTVQGHLRATQQGEMIRHRFGLQKVAERTLAIYTTATLEATLCPIPKPKREWRKLMENLSESSLNAYQSFIKKDPHFTQYFYTVTPIREFDKLTIASRPVRRYKDLNFENLRAIPWVFSWTQNRLLLPTWFGVGQALKEVYLKDPKVLKQVNKEWLYFSSFLNRMETVLAKIDLPIFLQYERELCTKILINNSKSIIKYFKSKKTTC